VASPVPVGRAHRIVGVFAAGHAMPRPELPIDTRLGPVAILALELRSLRYHAGCPSYRLMAERAFYSPDVLSRAASGRALPSRRVLIAYVSVLGGDIGYFCRRWEQVRSAVR
jgi:hypothetical protein